VQQIIEASESDISDKLTKLTAGFLLWAYEKMQDENLATFDRIAKSAASTSFIKQNLDGYLKVALGVEEPWFDEF